MVAAGLMGVNVRAVNTEQADPAIANYLHPSAGPAELVLTTAALMATAARATVEPIPDVRVIARAPTDSRPAMSPLAAQLVVRGMEIDGAMALWVCRRVVASGCAPTPTLLPALVSRSAVGGQVAQAISQIVGDTGRWLSDQAPELRGRLVVGEAPADDTAILADSDAWTHGTLDQREQYLRALRRASAQHGVELLASTWSAEAGAERERLIGALAIGAVPDDEQLLERALDDRRKGVRSRAARLLAARPGSALRDRLADVLFTVVSSSRGRLGRRTIVVNRGVELPESLARDGISFTPPKGMARFDHVLAQLISAVELGEWQHRVDAPPSAILGALAADDYPRLFLDAVAQQRDRLWARAVVDHVAPTPAVAALLDPDVLIPLALDELTALTPTSTLPALRAVGTPWPDRVARRVVTSLSQIARQRVPISVAAAALLELIRVGLPVDDATPESPGRWVAELTELRQVATAWGWPNQLALCTEALLIRSALTRELP